MQFARSSAKCEGSKVSWKTFLWIAFFLAGVLTGLKTTGQVDWSWWAILSPIWGSAVFLMVVFVLAWGDMFGTGR